MGSPVRTALKHALLMAFLAPQAMAQADHWGHVKVDARQPPRVQADRAHQAELQDWFMKKIQAYQHALDDTAVGKANPRIVDLGDWPPFFRRILAPPTGTGTTTITFGNRTAPSTFEGTAEIEFPQATADAYIDGNPNTCWHEFQHAIVMASERAGRRIAIPRAPWSAYAKPSNNPNDYQILEHIYMEGLAEYTVEWLDLLLHDPPGLSFERHARDAFEQTKQYQARNESISYAVENFCWAKAHDAWCRAWERQGKLIAPIPLQYRQDYRQICGVWIGFVEDIIRYYMEGGLKSASGSAIRVPEWVMNHEPMKTGVLVGHLNEAKAIQGDTLRYGFDVRVMENYRHNEHSESLNHGKVQISLENPDGETSLELAVDGKPVRRSGASGKIDLAGFKTNSRIRLTLVRGKLSGFAGVKRYRITVAYEPDPRQEKGVRMPPVYYPSKAIYYFDVTGSSGGQTAATTSGKGSSAASTPQPTAGAWKLAGIQKLKNRDKRMEEYRKNQLVSADAVVNDTDMAITESWKGWDDKARRDVVGTNRFTVAWNHPGTTLTPGTKVPVKLTMTGDKGLNAFARLKAWVTATDGGMTYGLWTHAASGGTEAVGGGVELSEKALSPQSRTIQVPIPTSVALPLTIEINTQLEIMSCKVRFQYVPEKSAAAPGKADAKLTAEEREPEPEPAGMDNVPPKPGELVKIPQTRETPPQDRRSIPVAAEVWYTHAEGDYRFKVPKGWKIFTKQFFDDASIKYDTLWPADKGMVVVCARAGADHGSKPGDAVLKEWAGKLQKDNPGASVASLSIRDGQGIQVAAFDRKASVMHWYMGLYHRGRSHFMSLAMPTKAEPPRLPDPMGGMLGSLVFLR